MMKVVKAQVQLTEGPDNVVLWTNLSSPYGSSTTVYTEQTLTLTFHAPYDKGIEFVKSQFNIEPEVINRRWNK